MKKIYEKPVMVIESLVAEDIMVQDNFDPQNLLSYNTYIPEGGYGTYGQSGFINFAKDSGNTLNSIDYDDFAQ